MKIYWFNSESGIYLGEDFADEESVQTENCRMPDDATVIPPPRTEAGDVAVFHPELGKWEIQKRPRNKMGSNGTLQTFNEHSRMKQVVFSSKDATGPKGVD